MCLHLLSFTLVVNSLSLRSSSFYVFAFWSLLSHRESVWSTSSTSFSPKHRLNDLHIRWCSNTEYHRLRALFFTSRPFHSIHWFPLLSLHDAALCPFWALSRIQTHWIFRFLFSVTGLWWVLELSLDVKIYVKQFENRWLHSTNILCKLLFVIESIVSFSAGIYQVREETKMNNRA